MLCVKSRIVPLKKISLSPNPPALYEILFENIIN